MKKKPTFFVVWNQSLGEYNSICTSLAPVTGELTYQQAQLIRQAEKELHGITFRDYFTRAEGSDFLAGRTGKFRATFAVADKTRKHS